MVTQEKIAKQLGISRATVGRAINGSPLIKEETKRKVLELVKKTNYEKNYVGSSLAQKKTKQIYAFIIKSKNEFYTSELKHGLQMIEEEYKAYNYKISIKITDINDPEKQLNELEKILNLEELSGIIITPLDKEKIFLLLKPYLAKLKIISLGTRLHNDIPHVGPDYVKQGRIVGELMCNMLRDNEKLLVIDNGDDKISSKFYLEGFLKKIKKSNINILGPIEKNGIEESINLLIEYCNKDNISGIYINRYAYDIYEKMPLEFFHNKKIVTNGSKKNIKKIMKQGKITAIVMEEVLTEGYTAGKLMFEMLYKNKILKNMWEISKSHIIFSENLENY